MSSWSSTSRLRAGLGRALAGRALRRLTAALVLLACAAGLQGQSPLLVYDFHLELGPVGNVDHVRSLGFGGLVTRVKEPGDLRKLADYARHVATLDDFELLAFVPFDFTDPASPDVWRRALPLLASLRAPLWVVVRKAPSQAAVRQLLEQMAHESGALGVATVVYPHFNTSIQTAAEASALIDEIRHPNLGNSLHVCHEIRGGNQYTLDAVVAAHAPETALVAISGAEENAYAGPYFPWIDLSDCPRPLAEDDFSLLPFLQALHDSGYAGPVILQTFGITDEPGHLEASLLKYAEYTGSIVRAGDPGSRP